MRAHNWLLIGIAFGSCSPVFKTTKEEIAMSSYSLVPNTPAVYIERSARAVLDYRDMVAEGGATMKSFGKMSNSRAPAAKTAGAVSTPGTADSQDPANSQKRDTQSDLAFRSVSSYTLEVEGRIKILNESGLERRKISEVMPAEASLEEFAAASFGQAGEVAQVDRKAVEVSDGSIRFEIPGAAIGSVLEYHYKFQCRDLSTFRGWTFQTDLPVQKSTFRIKMMQATSLPYRFVKTAENQVIDPSQENVLGIDRTPWVVLTWTQSDLLGVDHGPRAALLIGD